MENIISILKDLGLDKRSAEIFVYLSAKKKAGIEEIFENTEMSMAQARNALNYMLSAGVIKFDGSKYTMSDYQNSMTVLLNSRMEDLRSSIKSYRPDIAAGYINNGTSINVVHDDISAVPSFTADKISSAKMSVEIITRSLTWLDDDTLAAIKGATDKGVNIRVITYYHPELLSGIKALKGSGVSVKSHEYSRDVRFILVDGEFVAFAIREPPRTTSSTYFGLWINNMDVCSKVLEHIFEPAWAEAEEI